jgi:hypothetical protein
VSELDERHVTYFGEAPSPLIADLLSWGLPLLLFVRLWMFFIRRMGLTAVGKSWAKIDVETDTRSPMPTLLALTKQRKNSRKSLIFSGTPEHTESSEHEYQKGILLRATVPSAKPWTLVQALRLHPGRRVSCRTHCAPSMGGSAKVAMLARRLCAAMAIRPIRDDGEVIVAW